MAVQFQPLVYLLLLLIRQRAGLGSCHPLLRNRSCRRRLLPALLHAEFCERHSERRKVLPRRREEADTLQLGHYRPRLYIIDRGGELSLGTFHKVAGGGARREQWEQNGPVRVLAARLITLRLSIRLHQRGGDAVLHLVDGMIAAADDSVDRRRVEDAADVMGLKKRSAACRHYHAWV